MLSRLLILVVVPVIQFLIGIDLIGKYPTYGVVDIASFVLFVFGVLLQLLFIIQITRTIPQMVYIVNGEIEVQEEYEEEREYDNE